MPKIGFERTQKMAQMMVVHTSDGAEAAGVRAEIHLLKPISIIIFRDLHSPQCQNVLLPLARNAFLKKASRAGWVQDF